MKIGKIEVLRVITSLLSVLFFVVASTLGLVYGTTCALTFGSFTLISPLELALVTIGTKTILASLIVPGLIAILIVVFFGRFFCGWICPVGMLLEYSHIITEKSVRKSVGTLRRNREKYAILLAVLGASLLFNFTAPYVFSPPGIVYRTIIYFSFRGIIGADLTVLLLIFILDFLAIRFGRTWCNTVCPLGTVISSLSILNLVKPKVDLETCIDFDFNCLNCERICPMRIPVIRAGKLEMMECNKCLKCWADCPVRAIKITVFG